MGMDSPFTASGVVTSSLQSSTSERRLSKCGRGVVFLPGRRPQDTGAPFWHAKGEGNRRGLGVVGFGRPHRSRERLEWRMILRTLGVGLRGSRVGENQSTALLRSTGKVVLGVAIVLAVASLGVVSPPGAVATTSSSDWTTYLAGNDRTGFGTDSSLTPTSAPNLHLAWKASDSGGTDSGVFSQPIVSNGIVYWGSFDGYERATTTAGNLVWTTNLGITSPPDCVDPSSAGIASTATITSDVPVGSATSVLYVGGGNSTVYALNAATGAVLWSYNVGGNPNSFVWSSPAVFDNSVYIGVSSFGDCPLVQGEVLQLNRVTGALQNTFDVVPNGCTGGGVWSSPTVDAAAGTIYFDSGNPGDCSSSEPLAPAVIEVNASNLSLVSSWTVPAGQQTQDSDFGATPTLFNGVIGGSQENLVGLINKNGTYYAFERGALAAGPVWTQTIAIGGSNPTIGNGDIASSAFDGTKLYVGGDNTTSGCSGTVNALNPSTGSFIWQYCFTDGGFVLGGVTVDSGGVVAVGEGNNIQVLSAATGALVFTYAGVGPFWGPPSIADGALYEGDMSGHLYALTTPNQAPSATIVLPANGTTLSGSTYLDASASDATSVEFLLFGGDYGYAAPVVCTATLTAYGWLCAWNTSTVPNGSYTLLSEAFNSAGSTFSSGVSISVKNPLPTTSLLIPSKEATLSGSTYLDASASNATSVEFRLFGGTYGYAAPVVCTATLTGYGWLCDWNTSTVPNGSYTLLSEAFNSAGNTYSSGVSVTVDN